MRPVWEEIQDAIFLTPNYLTQTKKTNQERGNRRDVPLPNKKSEKLLNNCDNAFL